MIQSLDQTDISILQILQENARLTNKEIGKKLNKTPTPIFERIKRLQEHGFIKGYVAVLDHKKIDRGVMAFTTVQIRDHSRDNLVKFIEGVCVFDDVLECYRMAGDYDFLLRVAVKDLEAYDDFLMNKLFKLVPRGSIQTTFVLKEAKHETRFALPIVK